MEPVNYFSQFFLLLFKIDSPSAASIHRLWVYFLIAAAFVLAAVIGSITYVIIKYPGKKGDKTPKQIHGNLKVEVGLTLLATALVGLFFYLTVAAMEKIQPTPPASKTPDIVITGHQWWWSARYPKTGVIAANEIHMPVGKKLLIHLTSADVIHDFWVPALGRKMDVNPGVTNELTITVDSAGTYHGFCAEFCGAEHANMRITVVAQSPKKFKQWEQHQLQPAQTPQNKFAKAGAKLFQNLTCGDCHAIKGTPADGRIGPNLTHVGSRKTLLSGMEPHTYTNMQKWLENPQKIKPGAHMPRFILTKKQFTELTSYVEGLN